MLSRLFSKKPAPDPKPGPQLGMLALRSLSGLTPDSIMRAWASLFPDLPPLKPSPEMKDGDKAVMAFHCGPHALMIADIDMPIPQGDIDSATPRSWMWKTAAEEMKAHKAHAITMCVPAGDAIQEALAVSRLLCAAAAAGQAVGIYWGNGGHVHSIPFFTDGVKDMADDDTLPVMLWVGLMISGESERGPFTLSTWGMPPFGHKEIEIIDTTKTIGELRMMTFELINYLLLQGPILKHGQTFGSSETERFKVEHTTSRFRKGDPVIRLHVP